jgi:hypothetical protein
MFATLLPTLRCLLHRGMGCKMFLLKARNIILQLPQNARRENAILAVIGRSIEALMLFVETLECKHKKKKKTAVRVVNTVLLACMKGAPKSI